MACLSSVLPAPEERQSPLSSSPGFVWVLWTERTSSAWRWYLHLYWPKVTGRKAHLISHKLVRSKVLAQPSPLETDTENLHKVTAVSRWDELLNWNEIPEILKFRLILVFTVFIDRLLQLSNMSSSLLQSPLSCCAALFPKAIRFRNRIIVGEIIVPSVLFRIGSKQKQVV